MITVSQFHRSSWFYRNFIVRSGATHGRKTPKSLDISEWSMMTDINEMALLITWFEVFDALPSIILSGTHKKGEFKGSGL